MSGDTCRGFGCNRQPLDLWPGGYCRECFEKKEARLARRRMGGEPVEKRERQIPEKRWRSKLQRDLDKVERELEDEQS